MYWNPLLDLANYQQQKAKARISQANANTIGQQIADKLRGMELKNQALTTSNQYLPGYLQARNQGENLANMLKGIDIKDKPALDAAMLNLRNTQTKLMPERLNIMQQMAQNSKNRQTYYNSPNYQYNKNMSVIPAPLRYTYMGQHPAAINTITDQAVNAAANAANGGSPNSPPLVTSTPEQVNQFGNAAQQLANKAVTTAATQRQIEAGQQVENMIKTPDFKNGMNAFIQYAGIKGKGKEFLDKWTNSNQSQLVAAQNFKNAMGKLVVNRIKAMDNLGSDIPQREELKNTYQYAIEDPSSNPQRAKAAMQLFIETLQDVDNAINKSGQKIFNTTPIGYQNSGNDSSNSGYRGYSDAELNAYAKKYKMSVDDVKKQLDQAGAQ